MWCGVGAIRAIDAECLARKPSLRRYSGLRLPCGRKNAPVSSQNANATEDGTPADHTAVQEGRPVQTVAATDQMAGTAANQLRRRRRGYIGSHSGFSGRRIFQTGVQKDIW